MITMKTSITSSVRQGQKEQCIRVICDAVRKGAGMVIDELTEADGINAAKLQRVVAQGDNLASAVIAVVKEKVTELSQTVGPLKQISGNTEIIIGSTDGTETRAHAIDVFSVISSSFTGWGCDVKEEPTEPTRVEVYKMIADAAFQHMFGCFGQNLAQMCLTQGQIKRFTKDHKNWFCNEGHGTFFLFQVKRNEGKSELFVANARLFSVGYFVANVQKFSSNTVHRASGGYRIVIPLLV